MLWIHSIIVSLAQVPIALAHDGGQHKICLLGSIEPNSRDLGDKTDAFYENDRVDAVETFDKTKTNEKGKKIVWREVDDAS